MVKTVKDRLFLAFEQMGLQDVDEWVSSWPGQATYVSSQIWFSMKVISIFAGSADRERALRYAGNANKEENSKDSKDAVSQDSDHELPIEKTNNMPTVEEDEADAADERAYEEEVNREIAQLMESEEPERGQLEKILRLKRRFRVNKTKSAVEQFDKLMSEI